MSEVLAYVLAVADYWTVVAGGTAMTLLGILYERRRGQEIHWRLYRWLLGVCLLIATFLAWRDEYRQRLSLGTTASTNASERDEARRLLAATRTQIDAERQRTADFELLLHKEAQKTEGARQRGSGDGGSAASPIRCDELTSLSKRGRALVNKLFETRAANQARDRQVV